MSYYILPIFAIVGLLGASRALSGRWPWQPQPDEAPDYMSLFQQDGGQSAYEPLPVEVERWLRGEDFFDEDEEEPTEWDYEPREPYW